MKYPRKIKKLRKVKLFEVSKSGELAEVIAMHDEIYFVYKGNWYRLGDRELTLKYGLPSLKKIAMRNLEDEIKRYNAEM